MLKVGVKPNIVNHKTKNTFFVNSGEKYRDIIGFLLQKHMEEKIQNLMLRLEHNPGYDTWRELAEVVLARLICFNKRRSNEPSGMLVEKFKTRPSWKTANAELIKSLNPLEKQLLEK